MTACEDLVRRLLAIDGQSYRAYKSIGDEYRFPNFLLRIDHVQGDPFADPSRLAIEVPAQSANLPRSVLRGPVRRVAAADFLNRVLAAELASRSGDRGSGRSGELTILSPGQEVLRRTSLTVREDGVVEARLRAGLPARGRTVLGRAAVELLCEALPAAIVAGLTAGRLDLRALHRHVEVVEDARAMRDALDSRGLVAFVADGAVLPRRSGVDDRPLDGDAVVPFQSPESLRVTLQTPNGGPVAGMGIPEGVTLLAGGGFHGKSTLLRAIQRGVYDHAPGDGRERVVARSDAVKVRAEDGRAIRGTDISNFIADLPGGVDTSHFVTENASGSTSQAAAIAEALELRCRCLLLDEDTSATNFLIRDARVQALISNADEPIIPFIDRVAHLRERGVSLVVVVGGSGDFFDVADTVIAMRAYEPREVTAEAQSIVAAIPTRRATEHRLWSTPAPRCPAPGEIRPGRGRREVHVKAHSPHRLAFGTAELDLTAIEQLVESAQTRAIARTIAWARDHCIDGDTPIDEALRRAMGCLERDGLDVIDDRRMGEYAEFRVYELAAVLNRLR